MYGYIYLGIHLDFPLQSYGNRTYIAKPAISNISSRILGRNVHCQSMWVPTTIGSVLVSGYGLSIPDVVQYCIRPQNTIMWQSRTYNGVYFSRHYR